MSSDLPALFHVTPKQPYYSDINIIVRFRASGGYFSYPETSKYSLPKYCEDDYVVIRSNNENTNANMYYWSKQGVIRIVIYPRTPILQTDNQLLLIFNIEKISDSAGAAIQLLLFNDELKQEVIDGDEFIAILTDIPARGYLHFYVRPYTTSPYYLAFKSVTGYLID